MRRADNLSTFPIVLKYGNLNLLEPSGPVQACNGIALRLSVIYTTKLVELRLYCAEWYGEVAGEFHRASCNEPWPNLR
jgi:hypothetical protein